jgi:fatty acid synthase
MYNAHSGPSTAIDTACSSSLLALENAFNAIRHGQCDAALVGGVNLLLKPNTSVQFMKLGMLSPEGSCKSFDASGEIACITVTSTVFSERYKRNLVYQSLHNLLNGTLSLLSVWCCILNTTY